MARPRVIGVTVRDEGPVYRPVRIDIEIARLTIKTMFSRIEPSFNGTHHAGTSVILRTPCSTLEADTRRYQVKNSDLPVIG
jgi:hypothetical protein